MRTKATLIIAALTAGLALAACGSDEVASEAEHDKEGPNPGVEKEGGGGDLSGRDDPGSREGGAGAEGKAGGEEGIAIRGGDSDYGTILFDGEDQALYAFTKESGPTSECYGACAEAWPPVITKEMPLAEGPVEQGLLGTTKRTDGSIQATYDGRPLYYYVNDPPGQVLCQNVEEFGGLWLVVRPDGQPVQ